MAWWDAIPAVAQGVGGAMASQQRQQYDNQALGITQDVYDRILAALKSGELQYTPEIAQLVQQGPSAMSGVQADPMAVQAQKDALMKLQQASQEGYNDVDKAAINRTMNEANANERAQREAALARLAPGSGAAIAARLSAQQTGANRASQQAMDIAANSRKQALAALSGYGNLAGQIRNQSFGEQSDIANAQDAISRFNTSLANNTNQFNAGAQNQAKAQGAASKAGLLNTLRGGGQDLSTGLYGKGQRTADQIMGAAKMAGGAGYEFFKDDEDK